MRNNQLNHFPEVDIINEPTVFVLGAGASHPYGFPLGIDLKNAILGEETSTLRQCLKEKQYDDTVKKRFKDALKSGDYGTIDLFLEDEDSYRELGAYFIADAIARRESHDALFVACDNWYKIFYNMLSLESVDACFPLVDIVTLNYDRSFKHFLTCYLEHNCPDRNIESGKRKLKKLEIIHAHGHIGQLNMVPYGEVAKKPDLLHKAAERIRIVSDPMERSTVFQTAVNLIGSAHNVIFIGFGYNKITLKRLLRKIQSDKVRLFGTGFQLGNDTRLMLERMFGSKMRLGDARTQTVEFLKQLGFDGKNGRR